MLNFYSKPVRFVWYAIIFIGGFVLISLWSFWLVTHPKRIYGSVTPEQLKLAYERVEHTTNDGLIISGLFFSEGEAANRPALILLHGYPADKADMLFFAREFFGHFDILLIDFRYFGESQGKYTTLGGKERLDLNTAINYLDGNGYENIGVMGFSLGGAVALMGAAEDERIDGVVSYASFADLKLLGEDAYSRLYILKYPMVWLIDIWMEIFYGVDADEISPAKFAKNLKNPVLIVHNGSDNQIPVRHGRLIQESLKDNPRAEFYFPEIGRHGELPSDFEERVIDFFSRVLR